MVNQRIREAQENKGDLNRHPVPGEFRDLILDYYNSFSLRVSSGTTTSEWIKLEKGIITGCTISVILSP